MRYERYRKCKGSFRDSQRKCKYEHLQGPEGSVENLCLGLEDLANVMNGKSYSIPLMKLMILKKNSNVTFANTLIFLLKDVRSFCNAKEKKLTFSTKKAVYLVIKSAYYTQQFTFITSLS